MPMAANTEITNTKSEISKLPETLEEVSGRAAPFDGYSLQLYVMVFFTYGARIRLNITLSFSVFNFISITPCFIIIL